MGNLSKWLVAIPFIGLWTLGLPALSSPGVGFWLIELGDEYREYMARTWRLVPLVF